MVKARGCGYHFFGPRQVRAEFAGLGERGPLWQVHLEAPSPDRVPPGSPVTFPVASMRLHTVWLAVAWMAGAPENALAPAG